MRAFRKAFRPVLFRYLGDIAFRDEERRSQIQASVLGMVVTRSCETSFFRANVATSLPDIIF
jgi:hypothetical protein